jgi:hypothetical protein
MSAHPAKNVTSRHWYGRVLPNFHTELQYVYNYPFSKLKIKSFAVFL